MAHADAQVMLDEIDRVLDEAGYRRIDGPLIVSGVPFEVVRAYTAGPGFLDLVVVLDATEGSDNRIRHGYWLIERIAQALDQTQSRRPLTAVVLHDPAAARVPTEDFIRLGRVLLVTEPDKVAAQLAPILPIVLESSTELGRDPLDVLLSHNKSGKDGEAKAALIQAARSSQGEVESVLAGWIGSSFVHEGAQ